MPVTFRKSNTIKDDGHSGSPRASGRAHPLRAAGKHLETFLAQVEFETGAGLPEFVQEELDAFLECGAS
jgi:hypothetical protein